MGRTQAIKQVEGVHTSQIWHYITINNMDSRRHSARMVYAMLIVEIRKRLDSLSISWEGGMKIDVIKDGIIYRVCDIDAHGRFVLSNSRSTIDAVDIDVVCIGGIRRSQFSRKARFLAMESRGEWATYKDMPEMSQESFEAGTWHGEKFGDYPLILPFYSYNHARSLIDLRWLK